MSKIINFDNARRIQNCSALCYVNSAINLLYSLVEFREKVYNTNFIPDVVENHTEQSEILYYLKNIFLLMNKDLTPRHDRYEMNDDQIICTRNMSKTTNNLFYNEIYYPFLKLVTPSYQLVQLESCGPDNVLFDDIIKKLNFISTSIFSFYPEFFVGSFDKKTMSIDNFFKSYAKGWDDIHTYSVIKSISDFFEWEESDINEYINKNFKINRGGKEYEFELIGCIVWGGGHYWSYIKKDSKFQKIDDIGKKDSTLFDNISGFPSYLIYKQSTYSYINKYPIKDQIINLANISSNIESDNVCKICTVENLPTATVCAVCYTSIIPFELLSKIKNFNHSIMKKLINYRFNTVICACGSINKSIDTSCNICTVTFSSAAPLSNF